MGTRGLRAFGDSFACQKKLGFSEGEAFRRIVAARLTRRFPVVISLLVSGRLNLSTLSLLRERLTQENHAELFAAVAGKRKLDVQMILAARFPRADRPSRIRREGSIEPLSEARFKVEFTASETLRKKLELCRDLMSHSNPSRDLAVIIERGVDLLLEQLGRKRLGKVKWPRRAVSDRGRKSSGFVRADDNRERAVVGRERRSRVTTAVRRKVYERDGVRCTYVSEDGRRCEARAFLELDHTMARALGGSDEATNLRVRCRAHNQLVAEQTFGREWMERSRYFRQRKSTPANGESAIVSETNMPLPEREASATIFEKVRSALRTMGFRDVEARSAIATVVRMRDSREPPTLEQALREALRVATAA